MKSLPSFYRTEGSDPRQSYSFQTKLGRINKVEYIKRNYNRKSNVDKISKKIKKTNEQTNQKNVK